MNFGLLLFSVNVDFNFRRGTAICAGFGSDVECRWLLERAFLSGSNGLQPRQSQQIVSAGHEVTPGL